MEKVILYYKFVPVTDPEMTKLWQLELCKTLGLKGRILISRHGINGTVGGSLDSLRQYKSAMNKSVLFKDITYKWSKGGANNFPRLSVKARSEIVSFGAADEIKVDEKGIIGGGKHLKPKQVHELLSKRGKDVVFFDGRNKYEAKIGKFKNAVVPDVDNTRDFIKEIENPKYDKLKDKAVVTYCTGGIRCEILSTLMKNRGFKEVYQIDGGIVKYGETFQDAGEWEGKLHIFDNRMVTQFSDSAKDIGECVHCAGKTSNYENCANKHCNRLVLVCNNCVAHDLCEKCAVVPV
ncbi:rhodanese-related sulfurtransferase [Candidatus Saccharibacteria bacterium]|nr:rhodanese-related sulfurtransferase [Candidatus Saccharibacteria bacterium]